MDFLDLTYCDDVRCEIGGKYTLCGVYQDLNITFKTDLTVSWPIVLPKFCAVGRFILTGTEKILDGSFLAIREGNDPKELVKFQLTCNGIVKNLTIPIIIPNFAILKPGRLDFRFDIMIDGQQQSYLPKNFLDIYQKIESTDGKNVSSATDGKTN